MRSRPARLLAAVLAVVVVGALMAWVLWSDRPEDEAVEAAPSPPARTEPEVVAADPVAPVPDPCDQPARRPFTPRELTVSGIVAHADVVGVPRDSRGVTGVLPFGNKSDFAWDLGGVRPGSRQGNVLLNTHTWPDGSAVGNAILDDLGLGERIVITGDRGERVCYRVTERVEVLATLGFPEYYEDDGPPRVAIIVCSGDRSADGDWSHRTIWFARQVGGVNGV